MKQRGQVKCTKPKKVDKDEKKTTQRRTTNDLKKARNEEERKP